MKKVESRRIMRRWSSEKRRSASESKNFTGFLGGGGFRSKFWPSVKAWDDEVTGSSELCASFVG